MDKVRENRRTNWSSKTPNLMSNSIYGSPFPKINPKVRYKTALERAGFDTKPRSPFSSQRNASTGSLQASVRSPPIIRQRNVSAAPSVPVTIRSAYTMSSKGTHSSRKDESGIYPLPVLVDSRRQSVCPSNNNNISSSRDTKVSHPISKANERASQDLSLIHI